MQKLKFITHAVGPVTTPSGGAPERELIRLELYSIYDTKPDDPHAAITWSRGLKEEVWSKPSVELLPARVTPAKAGDYAAILRTITAGFEEVTTAETDPDALLVTIERHGGVQVVHDERVGRLVDVAKLKAEDDEAKFWKPTGTSTPISVKASSEEAAVPLVSAAFSKLAGPQHPTVKAAFLKWVEAGMPVAECEDGAVPVAHPAGAYCKRGHQRKAEAAKKGK